MCVSVWTRSILKFEWCPNEMSTSAAAMHFILLFIRMACHDFGIFQCKDHFYSHHRRQFSCNFSCLWVSKTIVSSPSESSSTSRRFSQLVDIQNCINFIFAQLKPSNDCIAGVAGHSKTVRDSLHIQYIHARRSRCDSAYEIMKHEKGPNSDWELQVRGSKRRE